MNRGYKIITDNDYNLLCEWWNAWKFPPPPKDCLPRNGLIVYNEDIPVYAGFLYFTDSNIAWMEWVVSNKNCPVVKKKGGLQYLVSLMSEMARSAGMKYLYTSTVRPEFVNSLNKCGFITGDTGVSQLIRRL